jgi:vanillate O-demethylase ferredoxin subunit
MSSHRAQLIEKTILSPDIADLRFQILDGNIGCLEPGAHVDVRLAPDLVRQYSLWNWDSEGRWFNIAVKREPGGRGGSLAMHELSVGDEVEIGGPRNHFRLAETTGHIILVAGGIGVTPILAMAQQLHTSGADFRVFYLVRSQENAAMDQHFRRMDLGERYRLHCDDTDGLFDLAALMQMVPTGGDVYACGPEPMLDGVVKAGSGLRGGAIHLERFAAAAAFANAPNHIFEIELQSS